MRMTPPETIITCAQMEARRTALGSAPRFDRPLPPKHPVLRGSMTSIALPGGLLLHQAHAQDLLDADSSNLLAPGIKATFLLGGSTELSYGGTFHHLHGTPQHQGPTRGVIVALAETARFQRHWCSGRTEIKVCLTLTPEWITRLADEQSRSWQGLCRFSQQHLAQQTWLPSRHASQLAQRLFQQPDDDSLIKRLEQEAICNEIALEVINTLTDVPRNTSLHKAHIGKRMQQLLDFLDSGEADGLSLNEIARQLASNTVDLQRYFKEWQGITIMAYLRQRHLNAARKALQQGSSVELAAQLAGYGNAGSFATAFKRQFGLSPSQVSQRL